MQKQLKLSSKSTVIAHWVGEITVNEETQVDEMRELPLALNLNLIDY
jgi:hypothetical protein